MVSKKRILIPIGTGLAGALLLSGIYFGIVSWAESPKHAIELFWQDRWIVIPIILGFGIQAALYTILKMRLFLPVGTVGHTGPSGPVAPALAPGASVGAGGTTSTLAMVACCAHHVADVLPILGLTAAATFLAKYQLAFMVVGLGTTYVGIAVMLYLLLRERKRVLRTNLYPSLSQESA